MGLTFTKLFSRLFAKKEMRILMVGLDAAGGALKPTYIDSLWAHVTCAWFQPEVCFSSDEIMDSVVGILNIPLQSFYKICMICNKGLHIMLQVFNLLLCKVCNESKISHGDHARPPFDDLIQRLVSLSSVDSAPKRSPVIVSVVIPSGWHVEEGDINGKGIKPHMLISLTASKLWAKNFFGPHHFLGGRFVPPSFAVKYGLQLSPYPDASMCVRIGKAPTVDISSLRENYISPELLEDQMMNDPIDQFHKWFDEAVAAGLHEPNAMALSISGKGRRSCLLDTTWFIVHNSSLTSHIILNACNIGSCKAPTYNHRTPLLCV